MAMLPATSTSRLKPETAQRVTGIFTPRISRTGLIRPPRAGAGPGPAGPPADSPRCRTRRVPPPDQTPHRVARPPERTTGTRRRSQLAGSGDPATAPRRRRLGAAPGLGPAGRRRGRHRSQSPPPPRPKRTSHRTVAALPPSTTSRRPGTSTSRARRARSGASPSKMDSEVRPFRLSCRRVLHPRPSPAHQTIRGAYVDMHKGPIPPEPTNATGRILSLHQCHGVELFDREALGRLEVERSPLDMLTVAGAADAPIVRRRAIGGHDPQRDTQRRSQSLELHRQQSRVRLAQGDRVGRPVFTGQLRPTEVRRGAAHRPHPLPSIWIAPSTNPTTPH